MPFHALAKLELPREIINRFPRYGERRFDLLFWAELDQRIEKVTSKRIVGAEVVKVRIDGRRLGR